MHTFLKKLFLFYFLFLTTELFADNALQKNISISNATTVQESDSSMSFTVTIEASPSQYFGDLIVHYRTIDNGSSVAGSDYTYTEGDLTFPSNGATSQTITVPILDDAIQESDETVSIKITTANLLYEVIDGQGDGTIHDDDADTTIHVNVNCDEGADEGGISDTNSIACRITLNRALTATDTDITIHYETQNSSSYHVATPNVDYTALNSSVTFTTGESQKPINIPIIGDTELEHNEHLKLVISGSPLINTASSETEIWDDDGSFPELSFEYATISIIEGNSSQKILEANITLNAPALAGSHFTYGTGGDNDSAEDQWGDNDYIETTNDVNFTGNETYFTIQIPIVGDTKIEPDEVFHVGFWDLDKLAWGGAIETMAITILNDDGNYPTLQFNQNNYSITEGDSSTKTIDFTLSLDAPAIAGSHFDYYTQDGTSSNKALISDNDYMELNRTTYTFNGGERNITISVTINGDVNIEGDEEFYLKIDNKSTNLNIVGTQSPKGIIINDDGGAPFVCEERSYLFTSAQDAKFSDVYFLNLSNGDASLHKRFGTSHINATGYNVQDNYIYGFEYGNDDTSDPLNSYYIVQIDNQFNRKRIDIAGLPKQRFYLGDVSMDGILYLANRDQPQANVNKLQEIQRVDLNSSTLLPKITLNFDANTTQILTSDFAFNPKDNKLYMVNANNNKLIRVDPISGQVEDLGYIGISGNTYSVISFFDVDGNFYFYTEGTQKIYKIDISNPSSIDPTATPFSDMTGIINSGDGARCANAPVSPPISDNVPLTCDSSMYISSSVKRGDTSSTNTNRMWLHKINTQQNPFSFDVLDETGNAKKYNAIAYSDSGDANTSDFIFGLYNDELMRIGQSGRAVSLGAIPALSGLSNQQLYAGAIYDGDYYVAGPGVDSNKIFKINLLDKTVTVITLDRAISILDFSFTPDGQFLHGIVDGGKLVKINLTTKHVSFVGNAHTGYQFDSSFSDTNGRFFANDSNGHGFFEFNLNDGTKRFLSDSQPADYNDGANCLTAELVFTDSGDAPISYGNPRHNIANGIFMGSEIDHDINPFHTIDANGDDVNGIDDEDGVTLVDGSDLNGTFFAPNTLQELSVTVSKAGYLNVWIDYNLNGIFDASEKIFSSKSLTAGTHTLSFTTPNLTVNQTSYIRFRYSSTANLDATQSATDGEVEDYAIKFGSDTLRGRFNIERTNSASSNTVLERNAWYTQIVGRDFDYSLVFYKEDFSAEQNISNVTVNVDLMDMDTNTSIYNYKFHIPNNFISSRIDMTPLNNSLALHDLEGVPATKNARFRVTYGIDASGNIIQANCLSNPVLCTNHRRDKAKDNFAIRPDYYYMTILDNGNPRRVNTDINGNSTPLRIAAGYDYNLSVVAHDNKGLTSIGYTINGVKRVLEFLDKSNTAAPIKDDYNGTDNFIDGKNINTLLEIKEVGNYRLSMIDSTWTQVDSIKGDCHEHNSSKSANGNIKVGCDIISPDINLSSYPDHFDINLAIQNLPNSSHNDFIYMSEMNATANNISISYLGSITAQNADNNTTKNFTTGYFAQNVALELNATTLSDTGTNTALMTSDGTTVVNFARTIEFNNDGNIMLELNPTLSTLPIITIPSNQFISDHNGTANIDIRYNIDKNINKTINPIQITFNRFDASSANSNSISHGQETPPYIPEGHQNLGETRNFYFTQVAPDMIIYPTQYFNRSNIIRTPLNVDIFCNESNNYCDNTNVTAHSDRGSSPRLQEGWYLSLDHNSTTDGNVTALNPDNPSVTVVTPTPIDLPSGKKGVIITRCNAANAQSTISIITSEALRYSPIVANNGNNQYSVRCTENNASTWTGIGSTGNILEIESNVIKNGKMDW